MNVAATGMDSTETTDVGQDIKMEVQVRPEASPSTILKVPEEIASLVIEGLKDKDSVQETKATPIFLDIWDFAGQHLYYATHPFFFTLRAIYLLVYNLSKELNSLAEPCVRHGVRDKKLKNLSNETNLDALQSWLVSVHSIRRPEKQQCETTSYLRPPVILVGTHADQKSRKEIEESANLIQDQIEDKKYYEHVILPFLAVDNKQATGIKELRAKVEEVLQEEPYIDEELPVKWSNFEKVVKVKVQQDECHMKMEEVHQLARSKCFIRDDTELETMLNFYHDLGVIIRHRDTVVLQRQWLINLFKSFITIPSSSDMVSHSIYWLKRSLTPTL